ncbi:2-succinylbenzoate--CoA ligase, chloroplastic/peroxisomal-like isoform X4 [Mangifera indica]|uniref:2-succinylbenzoate--CoA ligase, chloroplastic/peroxisomal-like isoform X4 n=1 Tax=Mangifera indica TaxID=29780 RepID=UPI001CFA37DB|nr:2-succinylbenzoate--CoA ligase, chloroplastic/peroxisomal-like isoform X4 [Mangifera indica]
MSNYSQFHICNCLSGLAHRKRNSVVTVFGNRRRTGEQFVHGVLSLARGLLRLGLRSGDIVAVSAFNSDLYLEWLLAVAYIGCIAAPLNYRWSFKEARLAMATIRPVMLVTDESCSHWYSELQCNDLPSLQWHGSLGSPCSDFMKTWSILTTDMIKEHCLTSPPLNYSWAPGGAVIICFTSGTTGRPKGVTISHSALVVQSLGKIAIIGYSEDDVYLHTAPLCHIGGLSSAMAMLMIGGCHVLLPKFEAKSALEAIEQHLVTSLITVPTIMADLITLIRKKEIWKGKDSVRKVLNGGGSLSVELIKDAIKYFPGAKLFSAYGMTETCSSLTFMTINDPALETRGQLLETFGKTKRNSVHQPRGVCVGKPAPYVELNIHIDGSSDVGRILTRGPHVMLRYWDHVSAKPSKSDDEAWFDTGDIGHIDNCGNLWLLGQRGGRIKSGGENIYPEEVEMNLLQHEGVIAVVVVGIPDTRLMEMVVACLKLRENWQWSDNDSGQTAENKQLYLSRNPQSSSQRN